MGWWWRRGGRFWFDVHIFDVREPALAYFVLTFAQLGREGIGPRRGRAELEYVEQLDLDDGVRERVFDGETFLLKGSLAEAARLELEANGERSERVVVRFVAPTELKCGQEVTSRPEFRVLFGRIRDRVSTLRALYGAGPLEIDFKGMGERAAGVKMVRCE